MGKLKQLLLSTVLSALLSILMLGGGFFLFEGLFNRKISQNTFFSFGYPEKQPQYYATPLPGVIYHRGMFAVRTHQSSRWGQQNFPNGGHVFEGWNKDATHRLTLLVLEPNNAEIAAAGTHEADNLPRAAIQIFDSAAHRFGWLKVGSDSRYDSHGGWDFTDVWCKANTPLTFRKQPKPEKMPGNIPVPDGTFYVDEEGVPRLYVNGKWHRFLLEAE